MYEKAFGKSACAPNIHIFHHLLGQRDYLTLAECSTEPFESFYNIVRSAYRPGTSSIGKQILTNALLYYLGKMALHQCVRSMVLREKGKDNSDESYIFTCQGFYRILRKEGDHTYRTCRVLTETYKPGVCDDLPWSDIGVRKFKEITEEEQTWTRKDVVLKAARCNDVIVTIPTDALHG